MTETTKKARKRKPSGPFSNELLDQLLSQAQGRDAEGLLGESGLIGQLKKQLAERMLAAELTHHLKAEDAVEKRGNHRNGSSPKTVLTPNGALDLDIPRDRLATFEPQLVAKYQRRLPKFDDHVIGMYARGMTVREIQGHLTELYGLEVSPDLISTITDEVMTEVAEWQPRPLDTIYPIVYFDALRLKIRDEGTVRNKAVYLALGISIGITPSSNGCMNVLTTNYNSQVQSGTFEQRLNDIAWQIKCHWAKHFPIKVVFSDDDSVASMDYSCVFIHQRLAYFDDNVLLCVLAHEWAHRTVSPKSIEAKKLIIKAVADALSLDLQLANLVCAPAIELIVDRANREVGKWGDCYCEGFQTCFKAFVNDLADDTASGPSKDNGVVEFQQMLYALRLANVSAAPLPGYLSSMEKDARKLVAILFDGWSGFNDADDPNHVEKIIRFSQAYYPIIPKELLKQRVRGQSLIEHLLKQFGELDVMLQSMLRRKSRLQVAGYGNANKINSTTHELFDLGLTRQVTDHLMNQARKPRQLTGLWQHGHSISKLDLKRSFRSASILIAGMTTRKRSASSRSSRLTCGERLRLCLIVDDSGSMSGAEACFARSICEGVNRFVAIKDSHIGLITFGGDVDISIQPGRKYHQITSVLSSLNGNLGGTNLYPALKHLLGFVEADRDISHALLITDADFSDWKQSRKQLDEIASQIRLTVLMINSDVPEEIMRGLNHHGRDIRIFRLDPATPIDLAIIDEVTR